MSSAIQTANDEPVNDMHNHEHDSLHIIQVPRRFVANEWGGTETMILESSRALGRSGHHCEIHTTTALCDTPHENINGVEVFRHNYTYPFFGLSDDARLDMDRKGGNILSLSLLRHLLKAPGVDVFHAHSGKRLGGIVRTAARRRGLPYVITLHGGMFQIPEQEMQQMLSPLQGTLEWGRVFGAMLGARRVLDDADAIICVGQDEQQAVQSRYPHKRVEWVPNGVDVARFENGDGKGFRAAHNIPEHAPVLLCISRIDYQKNQLLLVDALARLNQNHKNLHLVIMGPVTVSSYEQRLKARIDDLGLHDHVTIIEGQPAGSRELVNAYHAADVFCLPSLHEPFGIVILEAWAAGLPVVASAIGGIPSFTKNETDILHADPSDTNTFVTAIDRLLANHEYAKILAENGKKKAVIDFDWLQVASRLESIYLDVRR